MIATAKPLIGDKEKRAVCDVLDSGFIATGAVVQQFEQEFAQYIGANHAIATTSGTTALEVALRALGIGPGDKVLTTPFSFIASTNSIVYVGATPVFADIDPTTLNISVEKMEEKLRAHPDIKALQIVHLFGQPCDMDGVMRLVREYNLLLIEDCAQAHGAKYKGQMLGTFGDVSAFSFYPTKNMTTGEGGAVLTSRADVAEKSRLLINHGMKIRYHHDIIGYNYRMTNIAAAIGLCQLKKLEKFNGARIRNAEYYAEHIRNNAIVLPRTSDNCEHCFHQYSVLIQDGRRDEFLQYLEAKEIGYGVFYPLSIPEQACYASMEFEKSFAVTDKVKQEIVSIPVHPALTEEEIATVAEALNAF